MSDREKVFSSIRKALQPLKDSDRARAAMPEWDDSLVVCREHPDLPGLWELFSNKLKAVSGTSVAGYPELVAWLVDAGATHGYCDPALVDSVREADINGVLELETVFDDTRPDDYAFGITRASVAIAESGTLVFKDSETSSRLAALAPWVHVAVIQREQLVYSIPEALARHGDDPNIIWATGPSKTADVEGILIEGVHGPGVQIACLAD